jgi:hypothetical protein
MCVIELDHSANGPANQPEPWLTELAPAKSLFQRHAQQTRVVGLKITLDDRRSLKRHLILGSSDVRALHRAGKLEPKLARQFAVYQSSLCHSCVTLMLQFKQLHLHLSHSRRMYKAATSNNL